MVNAMGLFLSALVAARCEIFKSCVLADEGHAAGANGPVTLLADNQFGDTLVLGVGVVDLVPVDDQDQAAARPVGTGSRRSELIGRLFGRCSRERLSWDSATTGTLNSLASALSEREISEISLVRFSEEAPPMRISCR